MPLLSVGEAWVERVNKNLLPLLNKFSIKRQGPFALSNIIIPVVDVETLEEVQAASSQTATTQGTLNAVNSEVLVTVPVGQTWLIDYVFTTTTAPTLAHLNFLIFKPSGSAFFYGMTNVPVGVTTPGNLHPDSMAFVAGGVPLTANSGDRIGLRRVFPATATAQTADVIVIFRRL